jgi:hypothetical protein
MRRASIIAGIVVLYLISSVAWQIGKSELANVQLRDDLHDMASQLGAKIGLHPAGTDEDFRNDVVRKARSYGIPLAPEQVTVLRKGRQSDSAAFIYLAAEYSVPIRLPGVSFSRHFNPESGPRPIVQKTEIVQ